MNAFFKNVCVRNNLLRVNFGFKALTYIKTKTQLCERRPAELFHRWWGTVSSATVEEMQLIYRYEMICYGDKKVA